MLHEKPSHENSSFVSYKSHPAKIPSQYCQTVNLRLTSQKIQRNIERPSTSIFNITQFVTTFTIPKLKSTTFPQNTNQPIYSRKRSTARNMNPLLVRSACATATKHFDLRRFFSEYAAIHLRRVSHNHMQRALVSIKDFSYLNRHSTFFFFQPRECWRIVVIAILDRRYYYICLCHHIMYIKLAQRPHALDKSIYAFYTSTTAHL